MKGGTKTLRHHSEWQFYSLSRYRNVLMGLQILLIIIFHFAEDCRLYDVRYDGLVKFYDIFIHSSGVDLFLLLSGMGLYFSMKKGPDLKSFYKKRFQRLLIPYVIVAAPAWLWLDVIVQGQGPLAFFKDFFFISFFFEEKRWFWYIFMMALCYLIFPYIFSAAERAGDRISRHMRLALLCMMSTLALVMLELYHHDLYINISIALSRLPAFFAGVFVGKAVWEKHKVPLWKIFLLLILVVLAAGPLGLADRSIIGVYIAALLNFSLCLVFVWVLDILSEKRGFPLLAWRGINSILGWFGKYTLELYLVHVAVRRVMKTLGFYTYRLSCEGIMVIISVALAVLLSKLTGAIVGRQKKRLKNK